MIRSYFKILSLITLFFSCEENPKNCVTISHDVEIPIRLEGLSDSSFMDNKPLESIGGISKGKSRWIVESPTFGMLKANGLYQLVFLKPNDEFSVQLITSEKGSSFSFVGKDQGLNNILAQLKGVRGNYSLQNPFMEYDAYKEVLKQFEEQLKKVDSTELPETESELLRRMIEVELITHQLQYMMIKYGSTSTLDQASEELQQAFQQAGNYEDLLQLKYAGYRFCLDFSREIILSKNHLNSESISVKVSAFQRQLKKLNWDQETKALLEIKNLVSFFSIYGITEELEMLSAEIKKRYPQSPYLMILESELNKFKSLQKGKKAPEFVAFDALSNQVNLLQDNQQLMVIDVWATWCGACIKEAPHFEKLKKKFSKEEVRFVSLSVDRELEKWKAYIEASKKGHFNIPNSEFFSNSYLITGIPRILVIDEQNNIVSAFAPSPSSGALEELIWQSLKKKEAV